ncbi:uncharacterized protein LOC135077866 [Ostrinia nubilalis]|uniref:uncharacterized protein LOC135077866 n=1 Tax=Ostrinia nubilalis TaxID=29057 RepID=UPI0030823BCE
MPLSLPRLTRCCFCLSLRTGSLIIGYVSILLSLLFMATTSYFLYMVVKFVEENKDKPNPEHPPDELAQVALGLYVSQAYYLLVYLYLIVISVMLVVGVHMNNHHLLRYYVYSGFFLFGMALALVVVSFVFVGFLGTLPLLKWCMTHFFCLLIVRSTYLEMEEQSRPKSFEMQHLYSPPAPINI